MSRARPPRGSRRARLEARRQRRQQRFGRFLGLTALGTLVPGAGLLAAGKRGWGKFFLTLVVFGVLLAGVVLWRVPLSQLASSAFDRTQLMLIAVALAVVAGVWLVVAVASHKVLEPEGLRTGQRLTGALLVVAMASLVVAPMAVGARYAWTHSNLLDNISREGSTTPDLDRDDPWADKPRVNVLLLGGDGGEIGVDIRTDTVIFASIDTDTGETRMFSLPRNLQNVPFPEGTELAERFPYGFAGGPEESPLEYMLNAVYNNAPDFVSEDAFAGSEDPGADAVKMAVSATLGVDVDYYVIANLDGFQEIIDAMGGITLDVNYPIPVASQKVPGGGCSQPRTWILPEKDKHLDGTDALWFARARCAPDHPDYPEFWGLDNPVKDDYNRMERQRCVIGAIADQAQPMNLLPRFQALAGATERNIATDIPSDMFPALAELGLKVKDASLTSLPFNRDVINPGDPDYGAIQEIVQEALAPDPEPTATSTAPVEAATQDTSEAEDTADSDGSTDSEDTADSNGSEDTGGTENTDQTSDSGGEPESTPTRSPDEPVEVSEAC
ncbi:MAG: LCP family protein [Actinomycetota bacterium]